MKENKGELKISFFLILVRPFAVLLILGAGISFYRLMGISVVPLLWIIVSTFILSFLFFISTSVGRPLWYFQMLGDLSIVTSIVYFTGGYDSIFSVLYFIPLILSTILTGIKGGFLFTVLISLLYTGILILHFLGYIPYALTEHLESRTIFYKGYIHNFSFYIVFLLSSYLVRRLRKERERVEMLRVTTQEIIENLPEKIFVINKEGEIIYKNDEKIPFAKDMIENNREINIDGRVYRVAVSELRNGELKMFSLRDITEEKKMDEEMKMKERTAFIGEISSGLAHEIRNPLSALMGCVETLKKVKDESKRKRLLSLIAEESEKMNKIIETFIRYAKMRTPVFEEVNPEILVKIEVENLRKEGREIKVNTQGESSDFKIDPELFILLFKNLMENAFEACENKKPVEVNLFFRKNSFTLEVVDRGKGIPEGIKEKIWSPFFSTKKEGVGMGLALVKRIAESHFARINLESREGEGTKISITFPKL